MIHVLFPPSPHPSVFASQSESALFQIQTPTHRLALERRHGIVPLLNVVVDRLELGQDLLGLLDGGLVLEDGLVSREVDLRGGSLEGGVSVDGGRVSGSERLEGREGLLAEAELGVDGRPVLRLVSSLRFTLCDMSCGDEVGVGVFKVFRAQRDIRLWRRLDGRTWSGVS